MPCGAMGPSPRVHVLPPLPRAPARVACLRAAAARAGCALPPSPQSAHLLHPRPPPLPRVRQGLLPVRQAPRRLPAVWRALLPVREAQGLLREVRGLAGVFFNVYSNTDNVRIYIHTCSSGSILLCVRHVHQHKTHCGFKFIVFGIGISLYQIHY